MIKRRPSGLLVAGPTVIVPKYVKREWIETLPDGRRVRVSVDDSGTVQQVEENDRLHALVMPKSVKVVRRNR